MVAVPDGELRRRLIGVEHLRQGWGRKRAGIARTGRPATGQPTRGTRTRAHWAVPSGTWRPGPDERRSVGKQVAAVRVRLRLPLLPRMVGADLREHRCGMGPEHVLLITGHPG